MSDEFEKWWAEVNGFTIRGEDVSCSLVAALFPVLKFLFEEAYSKGFKNGWDANSMHIPPMSDRGRDE